MTETMVVFEIDPTKKYALVFPFDISPDARERIYQQLKLWIESDAVFTILPRGARLVKVELPEEQAE